MRYLPISDIYITDARRYIKSVIERESFLCFDIETYKGACKLICDSTGRSLLNPTFLQSIKFLWYKANKSLYRSFYNLDFDISAILKLHDDIDMIDKLIHGIDVEFKGFKLLYIRPKMFKISKGHSTIFFTDLFNMYLMSLNKASETFLNDKKLDIINAKKLNRSLAYWDKNLDNIIKYCAKDAKLTQKLGNLLIKEIKNVNLQLPRYMTSSASLSKQYFRYHCYIPSLEKIPLRILDIAFQTYYGGRFEVLKRGYFDDLYYYDINSAYPKTISELPSLKYGHWKYSNEINPNECIGFYKVVLHIPEQYISALAIRPKKHIVVFPSGHFGKWITWFEADLMRDYIVKVVKGYEYIPHENEYHPFTTEIKNLYDKKQRYKNVNDTWYHIVKITMNALYGCFVEKHEKHDGLTYSGILFNPIWATIITAKTRWKLLKNVDKKDWKYIVAFHTDSVLSTKALNLKCNDKMGNWKLEKNDSGVILMTGVYQIGEITKRRGFKADKIDWIKLLERNKDRDYIPMPQQHVNKIAEILKRFRNLDELNKFIRFWKELRINSDKKRNWDRNFINCQDVLNSQINSKTLDLCHFDTREYE